MKFEWTEENKFSEMYELLEKRMLEKSYNEAATQARRIIECMINNMLLAMASKRRYSKKDLLRSKEELYQKIKKLDIKVCEKKVFDEIRKLTNPGAHGGIQETPVDCVFKAHKLLLEAATIYVDFMKRYNKSVKENLFEKDEAEISATKKVLIVAGICFALLLSLTFPFAYNQFIKIIEGNPEQALEKLEKSYKEGDWEYVYQLYDLDDSARNKYLTKELFEKCMIVSNPKFSINYDNYVELSDYDRMYYADQDGEEILIYVTESDRKYRIEKIDCRNLLDRIEVPVIPGVDLKIDGKNVDMAIDESYSSILLFKGKHELSFGEDVFTEKSYSFYTDDDLSELYKKSIKYSKESVLKAIDVLKTSVPKIVESELIESSTANISKYFSSYKIADLRRNDLCENRYSGKDVSGIKPFQFFKVELNSSQYDVSDGIPILVSGKISYQYQFLSDKVDETASTECIVYMIRKDGMWVIYNVDTI